MSAPATVPPTGVRGDSVAGLRHLRARLHLALRDPFALGVLGFAGLASIALWVFWLGIDPSFSCRYPWPGGHVVYNGPAPTVFRLAVFSPPFGAVLAQVMWAALVSWALFRDSGARRSRVGATLPALPVGPRARLLADSLAAVLVALGVRSVILALGGVRLMANLFGFDTRMAVFADMRWLYLLLPVGWAFRIAAYASAGVVSTLLGGLLAFPLVLSWSTVTRLSARDLVKPVLAATIVFGALSVGAMADLLPASLICVAASALMLVRLEDSEPLLAAATPATVLVRPSPGPLAQFRHDAWFGLLSAHGRFLVLSIVLPVVPVLVTMAVRRMQIPFRVALFVMAPAFFAALAQYVLLTGAALLPFGIPLSPGGRRPATLFSGAFLQSWQALPIPAASVVRVVYLHGLLASSLAWLVLAAQLTLLRIPLGLPLYMLPTVFLVPGLAVCEAVGDRSRGLVVVAALVGFQFGAPVAFAGLDILGHLPALLSRAEALTATAYAIAIVGILPPLVHLRGRVALEGPRAA